MSMSKIVISAQIDIDPVRRTSMLAGAQRWIDGALSQPGCIRYDWSVDLKTPSRINVFEEWESGEALAAHFAGPQFAGMVAHLGNSGMQNVVGRKYRVDAEAPVLGNDGKPTPSFD